MKPYVEAKITEKFKALPKDTSQDLYLAIKEYCSELTGLYRSKSITCGELGYYILPLAQFKNELPNRDVFTEIIVNAGLLELPESQLEKKMYSRQDILEKLISAIRAF